MAPPDSNSNIEEASCAGTSWIPEEDTSTVFSLTTRGSAPNLLETMVDEEEPRVMVPAVATSPSSQRESATPAGGLQHRRMEYQQGKNTTKNRLSAISNMYDRDNKGYLDPTEDALRRMDSQNLGIFANDKVFQIMKTLQEEQQKSAQLLESLRQEHHKTTSLKRAAILMTAFAMLLALSNIGTSFAAARLAKDVSINDNSIDLVSKDSGVRVATTPKSVTVQMTPLDAPMERRHRRSLQALETAACEEEAYQANFTDSKEWTTEGDDLSTINCTALGRIDYDDAVRLYQSFCPEYPGIAATTSCSNIGLDQILLQCGTAVTRILGGPYFPTAGLPGLSPFGSMIFPTPTTDDLGPGSNPNVNFYGLQMVNQPLTVQTFSLTVDGPTTTFRSNELCEEMVKFKIYCDPVGGEDQGICVMVSTYLGPARRCPGGDPVQLCRQAPAITTSRAPDAPL